MSCFFSLSGGLLFGSNSQGISKKRLPQRCSDASEMIQVSGQDFHLEEIPKEFFHFGSIRERLWKVKILKMDSREAATTEPRDKLVIYIYIYIYIYYMIWYDIISYYTISYYYILHIIWSKLEHFKFSEFQISRS